MYQYYYRNFIHRYHMWCLNAKNFWSMDHYNKHRFVLQCGIVIFITLCIFWNYINLTFSINFIILPTSSLSVHMFPTTNPLNQEFRFQYFYNNETIYGKPFNKTWNHILQQLNLLTIHKIDDYSVLNSNPVIATAVSSNHFREFLSMLKQIHKVYDSIPIYVYNLGLRFQERKEIMSNYSSIITELRNFSFEKYPPYVVDLKQFRWKPLVVAEILKDHQSVFWMDTSIRVKRNLSYFTEKVKKCNHKFRQSLCKLYPWLLLTDNSHSIYAATHPAMYEYFPIPEDFAKNLTMRPATMQLIYATDHVTRNALRYWVLCALEEQCMAPSNSTPYCWFRKDKYNYNVKNCHRQDQSAINLVLSALNEFDSNAYGEEGLQIVYADRSGS